MFFRDRISKILRMHFLTPESIQIIVLEESALSRRGLTLRYLLIRYYNSLLLGKCYYILSHFMKSLYSWETSCFFRCCYFRRHHFSTCETLIKNSLNRNCRHSFGVCIYVFILKFGWELKEYIHFENDQNWGEMGPLHI